MKKLAIEVKNVTLSYSEEPVVRDASFTLPMGSLVGVVGPNGAGKSTLIKAIVGVMRPDSGEVRVGGEPVGARKNQLTYVPQRGAVDWDFPITAKEVVRQGRYHFVGLLKRFREEDRRAVEGAMEAVGMTELADRQIGALSGGQQQRVFLARALAQGGDIFIMDEPFVGVDAATEAAIVDVLRSLRDQGKTVIVVHHDLTTVSEYFDQLVLLNRRIIAAGPTEEVYTAENLRETYGGRIAIFTDDSVVAG